MEKKGYIAKYKLVKWLDATKKALKSKYIVYSHPDVAKTRINL